MNVFIDTNIIIDVLDQREKFFEASSNILSLGAENKIELYATALTMANCIYILRKPLGYDGAVACINTLKEYIHISPLTQSEFDKAFSESSPDVEDLLQYYSANAADCDVVITRNGKHFPSTGLPILTPTEFLERYSLS